MIIPRENTFIFLDNNDGDYDWLFKAIIMKYFGKIEIERWTDCMIISTEAQNYFSW